MKVGETLKLAPSILPTKVIQGMPAWTSSRPFDVEVIQTDLYTATIRASKSFSGYATVHCLYYFQELHPTNGTIITQRSGYVDYNIFVTSEKPVQPTSISILPQTIDISYGQTKEIFVNIEPANAEKTISWSTTDLKVSFVNEVGGRFILGGNGYGTTTVTATTSNGLKASCMVTVGNGSSVIGPTNPSIVVGEPITPEERSVQRIDQLRNATIELLNVTHNL